MARALSPVTLILPLSTPARATLETVITGNDNQVFTAQVGGACLNCRSEIDREENNGRSLNLVRHKIA